ncbi:MAG: hypothetical protein AAF799_39395 [Myxococcota bacterium]
MPAAPRTTGLCLLTVVLGGCAGGSGPSTTVLATLGDGDGTGTTGAEDDSTSNGTSGQTSSVDPSADTTAGEVDDDGTDSSGGDTDPPPASCDDDPAACSVWILPSGAGGWMPLALDGALAPTETVRAAFDVESELEGFVVTDTRVHVVDLAARAWVRQDNRADVLPELGEEEVLVAYSIPSTWGSGDGTAEGVTFLTADTIYLYNYQIATQTFVFESALTDFSDPWDAPAAPMPAQMRASWLDVTNADGWYDADIMRLCGTAGNPGPYVAVVATDQVHVNDAGYCFEFDEPVSLGAFPPFSLAEAPGPEDVGALLYNETLGLWAFRGQ